MATTLINNEPRYASSALATSSALAQAIQQLIEMAAMKAAARDKRTVVKPEDVQAAVVEVFELLGGQVKGVEASRILETLRRLAKDRKSTRLNSSHT